MNSICDDIYWIALANLTLFFIFFLKVRGFAWMYVFWYVNEGNGGHVDLGIFDWRVQGKWRNN